MPVMTAPTRTERAPGQPWGLDAVAEYLGLCRKTIERAIRDRKVKAIRFGTRVMVPDAEVKRLAEQGL